MKKIIIAILSLTIMATTLTACGSKSVEDITEKDVEQAFGDSSSKAKVEDTTAEQKIIYAPTSEILNADLDSGLVQIGNDVFQTGGYITVREFVNKYKDSYTTTDSDNTGAKEILAGNSDRLAQASTYFVIVPIKCNENVKNNFIKVSYISKPQGGKCSIYDAVIADVSINEVDYSAVVSDVLNLPTWYPHGLTSTQTGKKVTVDSPNIEKNHIFSDYTPEKLKEFFEQLNLKEINMDSSSIAPKFSEGTGYYPAGSSYSAQFVGEKNLLGVNPVFRFSNSIYAESGKYSGTTVKAYANPDKESRY